MKFKLLIVVLIILQACKNETEITKVTSESITESIYASGIVKSKNQYQAFASVSGIIDSVYVSEGDTPCHPSRKSSACTRMSDRNRTTIR